MVRRAATLVPGPLMASFLLCTTTVPGGRAPNRVRGAAYPWGILWRGMALVAVGLAACVDVPPPPLFTQVPACVALDPLTAADVETIITQAAARAGFDGEAFTITVVSRDGVVIGSLAMAGAPAGDSFSTRAKARTAAFLSSNQHAFNTRTADFIIQDNFPPNLANVPGGPLFGVQFSSMACTDIVGEELTGGAKFFQQVGNGLSGDTGSMPLFKNNCLAGGVAVDGAAEPDDALEERAAWTASAGFRPALSIFGSFIFIDGISLAFLEETPPDAEVTVPTYASLLAAGGTELVAPMDAPVPQVFPMGTFGGVPCEIRYPIIDSPRAVPAATKLLAADVAAMFDAGAGLSELTRAGIRRPLGTAMRCFLSVVDLDGTILGCIRTPDATLFSFDVSIQKARTSIFFSTDTVAFTCRALGFLSQGFYPPGIGGAPIGPLNGLQDALSAPLLAPIEDPPLSGTFVCQPPTLPELGNGITIFPGAVPLYKGGVLVGAIGVSGDGVDQDDFIAQAGGELFPPPPGARADEVSETDAIAALSSKLLVIRAAAEAIVADPTSLPVEVAQAAAIVDATLAADARLVASGLQGIRLPYVKFPRQPLR